MAQFFLVRYTNGTFSGGAFAIIIRLGRLIMLSNNKIFTLPVGMIEVVISHSRMNVSSFIVAGKRNLNSFIVLYMPQ